MKDIFKLGALAAAAGLPTWGSAPPTCQPDTPCLVYP